MKKLFLGFIFVSTIPAFGNDLGANLKSCEFGFATMNYELVDLKDIPMEKGLHLYISKTKHEAWRGIEIPSTEAPVIVESKDSKILISYPIMNAKQELEVNQYITVSTKKELESNASELIFEATMDTLGIKSLGTCIFSL